MKKQTKFWFTIGIRTTSILDLDSIVKAVEENFNLKCRGYGTGKFKERQADFFVGSKEKRSLIRKFIGWNYGCKFYTR